MVAAAKHAGGLEGWVVLQVVNDARHSRPGADAAIRVRGDEPFPIGARVASERWGEGTIQRYDEDQVTVLFDDHGYRDLAVSIVLEKELLRAL